MTDISHPHRLGDASTRIALRSDAGAVSNTAFSADGKLLGAVLRNAVALFDVRTARVCREIPLPGAMTNLGPFPLRATDSAPIAFAPNYRWVQSAVSFFCGSGC